MRIGVIGAGAIGGTIAALLDRHGHDVEVTARGEHARHIVRHGLMLEGAWGAHIARVGVSPVLERRPELAVVATKAQDIDEALATSARLLDGVPVVVVQNGLHGVASASGSLPGSHVIGALALFAASFVSPGRVTVTAPGTTFLGRVDDAGGLPCLFANRTLSEVMPITPVDDFVGAQWTKLVINQVNAFPAMTGLSAQEVIADGPLRRALTASMREAARVGFANGVHFVTLQGLSGTALRMLARSPITVAQVLPLLIGRRMGTTPNPGSTLQSIRRGQPTEIDHLNGAVVRAAEAVGMLAPLNTAIVRIVHEIEAGRPFLTPRDVLGELRR